MYGTNCEYRLQKLHYLPYLEAPGYVSIDFIHEFSSLLMESESQTLPIIYAGDFNIWFDDSSILATKKFADTLNIFGLRNHVMGMTHAAGHMLDLIITRDNS